MYMYVLFIILYNTDQSSNNHIPLDNEYQPLSKPSHAPPPPQPPYYDTMNQNSSKVCMNNIQCISNYELLDAVPDIIIYHCTSIDIVSEVHCTLNVLHSITP